MKISEWMKQSGVAFGTSGARGLVAAMTDAVCFAYTVGFLMHLGTQGEFSVGTPVAVAGDLRPSSPRIMRACVAAIRHMGGTPVFCGYVPTPALCLHAFARGIPSLMVTGSHIPADRNGIKFNRARGEFLKSDEAAMRDLMVELPAGQFDPDGMLISQEELPETVNVLPDYISRYREFFGCQALAGLTLGIYQHSAVGRDALVQIVEALGATAVPLARTENFVPVDTEAVRKEDEDLAREWGVTGKFDAILTTDGDSDRPLLADRHGRWLRGDVLGILAARFLRAAAVTTPVSSNTALEKTAFAVSVRRTRIGSPYVVEAMTDAAQEGCLPSVGYEANGGFLLATRVSRGDAELVELPTRDAVLPMLCALVAAAEAGSSLRSLVEELPSRFTLSDRLAEMPTEISQARIVELSRDPADGARILGFIGLCGNLEHVDMTDGLRLTFANGEIIHLRPSGNAPELRVYVEADTLERAQHLLKSGIAAVGAWRRA